MVSKSKRVKKAVGKKRGRAAKKQTRSKPAKNMGERVQRKWLYQCAYWRICGSCTMREHCAKLVKELGVEKSWLTDQILFNKEEERTPVKAKPSRFLTEEAWLKQ